MALKATMYQFFQRNGNFSVRLPLARKSTTIKRKQIPLEPGYSCTAHKSQGQTLSEVLVDLVPD